MLLISAWSVLYFDFSHFRCEFCFFEFISLVSFLNIVGCKEPSGLAEPVAHGWLSFGDLLALFSLFLPHIVDWIDMTLTVFG